MPVPSAFTLKVIRVIQKIPLGRVATYGQVARLAGRDGASRAVVWILHSSSQKHNLPWHRVINAQGKIAFDPQSLSFQKQWERLAKEGVEINSLTKKIDLKHFQYRKGLRKPKSLSKI